MDAYRHLTKTAKILLAASFLALSALPSWAEQRAIRQRVAPVYPEVAKRLKVEGIVTLAVTVGADGKVRETKTIRGNRMLAIAAEDAVSRWKFAPAEAESTENVDINFELKQ